MKKPKNYTPQVRTPRRTAESSPVAPEREPTAGYERLSEVLDISSAVFENPSEMSTQTLSDLLMTRLLTPERVEDPSVAVADTKAMSLTVARSLIMADEWLLARDVDLAKDPSVMKTLGQYRTEQIANEQMKLTNKLTNLDINGRHDEYYMSLALNPILITAVARSGPMPTVVEMYSDDTYIAMMKSKDLPQELSEEQLQRHASILGESMREYLRRVGDNPQRMRAQVGKLIGDLRTPELRAFIDKEIDKYDNDWLAWSEEDEAEHSIENFFGGQEVDFSILPPGTDIREYTEQLYENLSEQNRAFVDLKRVEVLETLRGTLGKDRCYYVHGRQTGQLAHDENGVSVRPDYIGLVIQTHGTSGHVIGEDAIAISPVGKKHAGYLFRHDYSTTSSWRSTLSLSKSEARAIGARPLKFTNISGQDTYEAYVKKAMQLLTCPPEQFGKEYELRFAKGEYALRKRTDRSLGERAIRASML